MLLDSPVEVKGRRFYDFDAPQFSAKKDYVYFQIAFAATSGAIARLTVATKQSIFVAAAVDFSVIPAGRYKDYFIAQQRRAKLGVGYYDWFYLLDSNGKEVGVIGGDQRDVYNFLDTYVGDPGSCRSWNGPAWMTCVNQLH